MTASGYQSIEDSNLPLVFHVRSAGLAPPAAANGQVTCRVATRALAGMQKEALLAMSDAAVTWRLVCDEGPYLNGTDLAPPPLAYFSAGMANCYVDALQIAAADAGTKIKSVELVQDNYYSMEGSAVRGTMIAGALPVALSVDAGFADDSADALRIVQRAVGGSPIDALMRDALVDTFSLKLNDAQIPVGKVAASTASIPENPATLFDAIGPDSERQEIPDAVLKLESTDSVFEADHGAGAAMKEQQKRTLHIRSVLELRPDGLRQTRVQIFKPIGSVFQFIADEPGSSRAPTGLAFVSAGLAFCFMTQIGRYAAIVKKELSEYGIVQDTMFDIAEGKTLPVDTHAYLSSSEDAATAQKIIDMAEQTCFLHGACRMSNKTRLK